MKMKKISLLLALVWSVSCTNNQQNGNVTDTTDSVAVEEFVDVAKPQKVENTEVTINFTSYHLYTSEEDKYDASGYQQVAATVTIDEESKKASLKLYDSGEKKWYPFNFRIDKKLYLQDGVITYSVFNNANQKGYIYVSKNRPGGLFVDINNFVYDGDAICCWMQENDSSGDEYRQSTITVESTPNTYPSNPSYSPNLVTP